MRDSQPDPQRRTSAGDLTARFAPAGPRAKEHSVVPSRQCSLQAEGAAWRPGGAGVRDVRSPTHKARLAVTRRSPLSQTVPPSPTSRPRMTSRAALPRRVNLPESQYSSLTANASSHFGPRANVPENLPSRVTGSFAGWPWPKNRPRRLRPLEQGSGTLTKMSVSVRPRRDTVKLTLVVSTPMMPVDPDS